MDIQKFKETYKQVITESTNDSELKNYIRSIVEEVIKEKTQYLDYDSEQLTTEAVTQDARKDFKNNVLPVFKKIPDNGTINQEFKDAVENHVKEYGEKELANFMASEDGEMPKWYNTKSKTVKLGAPKFVPKEKFD